MIQKIIEKKIATKRLIILAKKNSNNTTKVSYKNLKNPSNKIVLKKVIRDLLKQDNYINLSRNLRIITKNESSFQKGTARSTKRSNGAWLFLLSIESDLVENTTIQYICDLGGGKGKYTRYYFLQGLAKILTYNAVEQFVENQGISNDQFKKMKNVLIY